MADRHSSRDANRPPPGDPLDELIETERARLMAAANILACAIAATSQSAGLKALDFYIPDVLEAAREKIAATINALDSVERAKLRVSSPNRRGSARI